MTPTEPRDAQPRTFRYNQLNKTASEIRLIKLLLPTRRDGGDVNCSMTTISLNDPNHEPYYCLSYVWGDATDKLPVDIEGSQVWVTRSLHETFCAVYDHSDWVGRWLWCDALCINQSDLDERQHQVTIMGRIYANATATAVYLGPAADDSHLAVELLHSLASCAADDDESPTGLTTEERVLNAMRAPELKAHWTSLALFCRRPWWRRAWVVQEFVLSSVVVLASGMDVFSGDVLLRASQAVNVARGPARMLADTHYAELMAQYLFGVTVMPFACLTYLHGRDGGAVDFYVLLESTAQMHATDPRDHLFAILGLCRDAGLICEKPDYAASVADVYTAATFRCAQTRGDLEILCYASFGKTQPGLPSWVPDFSYSQHQGHFDLMVRYHIDGWGPRRPFQASGQLKATPSLSPDSRMLKVQGLVVGVVDVIAAPWPACTHASERTESVSAPGQTTTSGNPYGTSRADLIDAVWRTFVLDTFNEPVEHQELRSLIRNMELGPSHPPCPFFMHLVEGLKVGEVTVRELLCGDLEGADTAANATQAECATPAHMSSQQRGFITRINHVWREMQRRFCVTDGGRVGMAPSGVQPGDSIVVLKGCIVPVVLRPVSPTDRWTFVGECYLHGCMYGEVVERMETAGKAFQDFRLV